MGTEIVVRVVSGAIVAVGIAAFKWLRHEDHRTQLRQRLCLHRWEPYNVDLGPNAIFITPYGERCRKCGALR